MKYMLLAALLLFTPCLIGQDAAQPVETVQTQEEIAEEARMKAVHGFKLIDTDVKALKAILKHSKGGILGYVTLASGADLHLILIFEDTVALADRYKLAEMYTAEHYKNKALQPRKYLIYIFGEEGKLINRASLGLEQVFALVEKYKDAAPPKEAQKTVPKDMSFEFKEAGWEDLRTVED